MSDEVVPYALFQRPKLNSVNSTDTHRLLTQPGNVPGEKGKEDRICI